MTRLERARLALDGLSVGDTFGERFFWPADDAIHRIVRRELPPGPWPYTDDTEMALSIFAELKAGGGINQDSLAQRFAATFQPGRGYGRGAYDILRGIREGRSWGALSRSGFGGMGSFGNGAAMRVGPLGGYYAEDDFGVIVQQARLSSEITHAHEEGIAGGIAVAVACALAWRDSDSAESLGNGWVERVLEHVPKGETHDRIAEGLSLPPDVGVGEAARVLGNGSAVSAQDTVPFCLWAAANAPSFEEGLWTTVTALGDRDTTCAIVGSMLALKFGPAAIPQSWLDAREPLPLD